MTTLICLKMVQQAGIYEIHSVRIPRRFQSAVIARDGGHPVEYGVFQTWGSGICRANYSDTYVDSRLSRVLAPLFCISRERLLKIGEFPFNIVGGLAFTLDHRLGPTQQARQWSKFCRLFLGTTCRKNDGRKS